MSTELINFNDLLRSLGTYRWPQVLLEMLLIGVAVYLVIRFLQGTRGARLLKGILFVLVTLYAAMNLLGSVIDTSRIGFLYERFLLFASLAVIIVFQPELRRALMRLGETRLFRSITSEVDEEIEHLVQAAAFCSKRKIGMLVAVEREVGLGGIAESGTRIGAELSAPLLNTIFWPNTPLHDLGVIVSGGKVAYAGVQFPLAESGDIERELGSRHRAAVGISQESDAVVVVVSEETGNISVAERGRLLRNLTLDALRHTLNELVGRPAADGDGGDLADARAGTRATRRSAASGGGVKRPPAGTDLTPTSESDGREDGDQKEAA